MVLEESAEPAQIPDLPRRELGGVFFVVEDIFSMAFSERVEWRGGGEARQRREPSL